MHIILGLLGTIVTILVLTNRLKGLGIDFGWLNPISWAHRRKWRKKYHADPAFSIESPLEAAAGLLYVAAKATGEMTQQERSFLLTSFEKDFNLSSQEAYDLLSSCAFIIKDVEKVMKQLPLFLQPSSALFSQGKKKSTLTLLNKLAEFAVPPCEQQKQFILSVSKQFIPNKEENW
jgi:hypothetical protein